MNKDRNGKRWFESSVNSYGRKTFHLLSHIPLMFESSVNSYGRKTE